MYELLTYHPTADDKIKGGCHGVGYGPHADFPDTKSFFVQLADGTKSPFSARKSVDAIFPLGGGNAERNTEKRKRECEGQRPAPEPIKTQPGCILRVQGLDLASVGVMEIKRTFGENYNIRFVEVQKDGAAANEALVRFHTEADCTAACASPIAEVGGIAITKEVSLVLVLARYPPQFGSQSPVPLFPLLPLPVFTAHGTQCCNVGFSLAACCHCTPQGGHRQRRSRVLGSDECESRGKAAAG